MKCVLLGIVAVIALVTLAESLICNKCTVSVIGICLNPSNTNCTTNTSLCSTSKITFPGVPNFPGINYQGCVESSLCSTTSGSIVGVSYNVTQSCCSSDNCNPVVIGGAPYIQLSLTAALSAALLSCFLGQSID